MSYVAGQILRASDLNNIVNPGWVTYTPTWTSGGGGVSLGNGTISAQYRQSAGSDLVTVRLVQTWGSTTANGAGIWFWSLPVTANAAAVMSMSGAGWILNAGDIRYPLSVYAQTSTTMAAQSGPFANGATTINNRGGDVSGGVPFTLATADQIGLTFTYQAA